MTVSENIKNIRKEKKLTQKRLGELSGIAEPTIRKYESGKLNPKIETIQKIADALEIPLDILIGWNRENTIEENLNNSPAAVQILSESMKSAKDRLDKRISGDFKELSKKINKNEYVLNFSSKDYSFEELLKILEYADLLKTARQVITVNTAHEQTDIEITDEMRQHDKNIINDDNSN